ncbi:hypothetical protein [Kribbella sp. NPDC004875]|uniref:hypothetical protein n=1 Tax=Kribbella sp. NPDC004875 TaxID=3364107 RepID=UPI0036AD4E29
MPQSDPEPAPDADPGTTSETGSDAESEGDATAAAKPKTEAELQEAAEARQRATVLRFLWSCAWLTVLAGVFLISGMAQSHESYSALATLGAVVVVLCLLALIAGYVACARTMITLRTKVFGRVDVFQVSTLVVVIAVICGLLVPATNTSALALLLPWALTYWMYGLDRAKSESRPS